MLKNNYTESNGGGFFQEFKLGFNDLAFDINDWVLNFFSNFSFEMKKFWKKIKRSDSWQIAGMLTFVSVFIFMYTMITESGTLTFSGDFKLQGMTFIYNGYDDWHYYFETGIFPMWDTSGLLGVNNISANSFYYLFDPFFLIMLPFPRTMLSQVQAWVTILKFVLAGVFFYHYLGSFNLKKSTRKVGAMAYAFCGWGFFYLWFFHFAEVLTFFPLMLWGVEKCFSKKDPRLLILSILLMGATNYQFLAIFAVCAFIYAIFRLLQTIKTRTAKENFGILGIGFIGFLVGLLLTGFIVIPNYIAIQGMPRISSSTYLEDLFANETLLEKLKYMFSWGTNYEYRYMYPLTSLLFINVGCWASALYYPTGYDNAGSSLYIFAPLLLMLVPSMIDAIKRKQFSHIIAAILLIVAVETPFIYYMAGAFSNYYGRWELFVVVAMIVFVCVHLDNVKSFKGWYFDVSLLVVGAAFAFAVYKAYQYAGTGSLNSLDWSVTNDLYYEFGILAPIQAVYIILIYIFLRFRYCRPHFRRDMLYIVGVEAIIMGNISIVGLGTVSYDSYLFGGHDEVTQQTEIISNLEDCDDSFYRVFNSNMTRSDNNLAMVEGYNGVGTFSSVYNYDSEDLYKYWSRISYSNTWSFGVHLKRNNLDELLGIKYYLLDYDDTNVPYGCVDVSTLDSYSDELKDTLYSAENPDNLYKLYVNVNFVDTAFAFDSYMSSDLMTGNSYEASPENQNEINYLKHAIIYDDYIEEHEEELSGFEEQTSSEYIATTEYNTLKYGETIYSSNWADGHMYTLDSTMTDEEYNALHRTELEQLSKEEGSNIYYDEDDDVYRYSAGEDEFFITPGDSVYSSTSQIYTYSKGLNYYSKVVFDDTDYENNPVPLLASEASERNGAYVSVGSKFGYNIDFYLYGYDADTETYHVITHDQHMQNNYDKTNDWKYGRGFYVDEPVYKVVGLVKENMDEDVQIKVNAMYYEYNDEYQEDVDKLMDSPISVTYRDANTVKYTSDYSKDKIVVLNIPYDTGWTLTQTTTDTSGNQTEEDVEYFNVDGGLIGYIAPEGEVSYNLSYYTPGLTTGLEITDVGLVFTTAIVGIYYSLNYTKKILSRIKKVYSLKGL
jgi:uncharacterized membrane protein YfhO